MSASDDLVEIAASITFAGDVADIADRAAFDAEFKTSMAAGIGVSDSDIIVDGVAAGSIVVAFHMLAPAAVQTEAASLVAAVDTTTISVTVNGASVSATGTLNPVVNAAPNVDCAGSWSTCAADCADKTYTISVSQSGLGSACAIADGASSACAAGEGLCPADVACVGVPAPGNLHVIKSVNLPLCVGPFMTCIIPAGMVCLQCKLRRQGVHDIYAAIRTRRRV